MEALTAEYEEEEVEEEDDEESAEAADSEAALDDQQWSGEEPELDSPQAEPLNQAEAIDQAQEVDLEPAEAASAAAECFINRKEEEAEVEESPEIGASCPLLSPSACHCIVHCSITQDVSEGSKQNKHYNSRGMASNAPFPLLRLQGNTGLLVKRATLFNLTWFSCVLPLLVFSLT